MLMQNLSGDTPLIVMSLEVENRVNVNKVEARVKIIY